MYCRLHRTCPGKETLSLAVAQRAQASRSTTHQGSFFCLGKCNVICNIKTGRHKRLDNDDRTLSNCTHNCLKPGSPENRPDSFDSDEEAADPVEDAHHVIFDCPEHIHARKQLPDLFNTSPPFWCRPLPPSARLQPSGKNSLSDENDAYEVGVVSWGFGRLSKLEIPHPHHHYTSCQNVPDSGSCTRS